MRRLLRRWWPWALAVTTLLLTGWVLGPAVTRGPAYDPSSTDPHGAKAAVDVLEELGWPVHVAPTPDGEDRTFLLLRDTLGRDDRREVEAWARRGGRLIVADPGSPLVGSLESAGDVGVGFVGPVSFPADCDDPALTDVDAVHATTWAGFTAPPADATTCFPLPDGWWMVRQPLADGELIALGGADAFTNARLAEADNAVLLARLLGPGRDAPVVVADLAPPGTGDDTLWELVPDRVYLAMLLLIAAFVLLAWERGRRLGAPVEERMPVRVPANELVLATGELMQRSQTREAAAAVVRDGFRRDAALRLGLGPDADRELLADRVAGWSGADPEGVAIALGETPPRDDAELLAIVRAVGRLRRRLHRSP